MFIDQNKCRGFTLLEVMVVVVIIAILSAIAIPSYQDYVTRSNITEAISGLSARQVRMEQCYQDSHTYVGCSACPADAEQGDNFEFSCPGPTSTAFTLTATGTGRMNGFIYTVNEKDEKKTTGAPAGWTGNSRCWVTRKGGVC